MIMDKAWLVNYAEKNMAQLLTLLEDEMTESDPAHRDIVAIIKLQDAVNFYDTILCLSEVLHPEFDKHLKAMYDEMKKNEEQQEKEAEESGSEELQPNESGTGD